MLLKLSPVSGRTFLFLAYEDIVLVCWKKQ